MIRLSSNQTYVVAIVSGAVLWQATALFTGRREAWDSSWYWLLAYPLVLVTAGVLGYLNPERPWRWPLSMMLAQAVVLAIAASSFGLLPLGLIVFSFLAVPPMAVSFGAANVRQRRDRRDAVPLTATTP